MSSTLATLPPVPAIPNPVACKPRWEPWPIGIAAFLLVFVSCVAAVITFAIRQKMDLVRPDYYEEEIRYQVQFDRVTRTRALGKAAQLVSDTARREMRVAIPATHVGGLIQGTIQFYRPSDARQDRVIPLKPGSDGSQVESLRGLGAGLWRARVRWAAGGLEYSMEESFEVPAAM
jgi:hypothetical protein